MLKQRVITAILLALGFLTALFALPMWAWSGLIVLMVWQGAVEWSRLAGMNGRVASLYAQLALLLMGRVLALNGPIAAEALAWVNLLV